MPASEDTSYNMKLLHRIFAVSSVALLAVTVWALIADHDRPWKQYQRDYRNAERTRILWELKDESTTTAAEAGRSAELRAELDRLTPTWFSRRFPWLGTKWLELPLLDAFNSPVRIDQIWLPELVQDYHHHQVERFDRCITCHVGSDQTRPGSATEPLFPARRQVTLRLESPPEPADDTTPADPPSGPANSELPTDTDRVARLYGMALASHGMLPGDGVSVRRVEPNSLATEATVVLPPPPGHTGDLPAEDAARELTGAEIREQLAAGTMFGAAPPKPGLEVGDVLVAVNGSPVSTRQDAERALLDDVEWGQSVVLTVARGVPQPFAAHPRLDLFLGASSPHPLPEVGCTICHAGQGSATAFDWATHTPGDLEAEDHWRATHDWFRDPHWESPMLPRRFIESSCIKCHHNVTDLEASPRFPDAPAPQVVAGYKLVRRYGCYGCHEMNGFDMTGRPIGPDLRLEPNDHAVARALMNDPGFRRLEAEFRQGIEGLLRPPVRSELKQEIRQQLLDDARRDTPRLSSASHRLADALRLKASPVRFARSGRA